MKLSLSVCRAYAKLCSGRYKGFMGIYGNKNDQSSPDDLAITGFELVAHGRTSIEQTLLAGFHENPLTKMT